MYVGAGLKSVHDSSNPFHERPMSNGCVVCANNGILLAKRPPDAQLAQTSHSES